MMNKAAEKAGIVIAEKVSSAIESKINPKTEWHRFSCELNHSFAVELHTDISIKKIMAFYEDIRCPLCYTEELKKQNNL